MGGNTEILFVPLVEGDFLFFKFFQEEIKMLDLKFVRENPEIVKQNIKNKFQDSKLPLVDEVLALDEQNRKNK